MEPLSKNPSSISNGDSEHKVPSTKSEKQKGKKKEGVKSEMETEGSFMLGDPTFVEIPGGGGRWRCVETGQEMPEKEKEVYSKTRACRIGLIDAFVAKKRPPLNVFAPNPINKRQLMCKITGDAVNKSEEHIWKHLNGSRFNNKLAKMEREAMASPPPAEEPEGEEDKSNKKKKTKKKKQKIDKKKEKEANKDDEDEEETDFWRPPVGKRWDLDDGKSRWESCESADLDADENEDGKEDPESGELATRSKRLSIEVGPSSFASRKKKMKKAAEPDVNKN